MEIIEVHKELIRPKFGTINHITNVIKIRKDLPKRLKAFVKEHELTHLQLGKSNGVFYWFFDEIIANFIAACSQPIGFILCVIYSLSFERLKFYYDSIRGK